jgi:hypothetical protein
MIRAVLRTGSDAKIKLQYSLHLAKSLKAFVKDEVLHSEEEESKSTLGPNHVMRVTQRTNLTN